MSEIGKIADTYTGNYKIEKTLWRTKYYIQIKRQQTGYIPVPRYCPVPWSGDGSIWYEWRLVTEKEFGEMVSKLKGLDCE